MAEMIFKSYSSSYYRSSGDGGMSRSCSVSGLICVTENKG